ncbi:MAG: hypothetical protein KJ069_13960 [Anaerolineae bacterium]|nr:hypothetical protein [Anaerolineae bacterium]
MIRTRMVLFTMLVLSGLAACATPTAVPTTTPSLVIEATTPPATTAHTAVPAATDTAVSTPTATPSPLPTDTPSATPTPTPTDTPTITPTPLPPLNGLTIADILIMDETTTANVRQIYAAGQQLGRDSHAYSVLGDSTVMTPHLLARFARDDLNLGPYAYLQPTVEHFRGIWRRFGVATNYGLHSWSVFDPLWADKDWCLPNEDLLTCEFRLQNPAFLLIRLGSNDAGSPGGFEYNVRQVIEHAIANGVVPIIITKPDRFEGDNTNNEILRQLAATYQVPIWDLDRVAETLPGKGLDVDQVHMVEYPANDFSDTAVFTSGHAMQDLSGLMVLQAILQTVQLVED